MARYATAADVQSPAYGLPAGALAGLGDDQAAVDVECERAAEAACDLADGYLAGRYVLPLVGHGTDLTRAVCAIATWDLMVGVGFNPEGTHELIRTRYEDAVKWLSGIAAGKVSPPSIVDTSPAPAAASSPMRPEVMSRPKRGW